MLEQIFFWITVFAYVGGSLGLACCFIFQTSRASRVANLTLWLGLITNLLTIAIRFARGGHLFTGQIYEDSLVIAAMTLAVYLSLHKKLSTTGPLGMILTSFSFLLLGLGHFYRKDILPLKAAYLSQWMVVHGLFALLAVVCFVVASGCSLLYLAKSRYPEGTEPPRLRSLPTLEILDELGARLILFGFFAWTVMLLSGAIWAKDLYGGYWSWDPVETWSLISWLAWGILLHLRLNYRRREKWLAWLTLGCLLTSIISLWGLGLVTSGTFHNLQQLLY
ncbi:MAG TPA: cytochrome c biogenesis protein CcsA [Bacillota bacterium]|nr:cytochrome c biogenesis protein CcsA [Bacillota bacterium]